MRHFVATIGVVSFGACARIAGIPEPAVADGPGADSSDATELSCDHRDDDLDGLVDEGYVYVEALAARRTVDAGAYAGLWFTQGTSDRFAAAWTTGDGTAGDVVSAQVFALDTTPTGARTTTSIDQPWTVDGGLWVGEQLVIAATQRDYACGGSTSTTCSTYLWTLGAAGAEALAPTAIATGSPDVVAAFSEVDRVAIAVMPPGGVGSVRLRTFTPAAAEVGAEHELFATAPGESILKLRAVRSGTRVYWTYSSNQTGFTLRVTDTSGVLSRGPVTLSTSAVAAPTRGSYAVVHDSELVIVYAIAGSVSVGAWTLDGEPLWTTRLPAMVLPYAIVDAADQLYAMAGTREPPDDTPRAWLWRLAPDGRMIQPAAMLDVPDGHNYVDAVATSAGVVVGIAAYGEGAHPITLTHLGCP